MGRLRRFPDYRIIGRRDQMTAFDCDDEAQFELLKVAVDETGLDMRNLLQAFAPDTLEEARNRGFRAFPASHG
jgi:hypothetical protein